jgi:hypothetical protein
MQNIAGDNGYVPVQHSWQLRINAIKNAAKISKNQQKSAQMVISFVMVNTFEIVRKNDGKIIDAHRIAGRRVVRVNMRLCDKCVGHIGTVAHWTRHGRNKHGTPWSCYELRMLARSNNFRCGRS